MAHPKEVLKGLDAAPLKALSQNFLTSPHWPIKLVESLAENSAADAYWEIGPGLGAITEVLLQKVSKPVTLFEFDRKLSQYLRGKFPNVELLEGDVMDADFKALARGKNIHVLSNLPYHLSSPILFKLAEIRAQTPRLVLTFQKEFAQRLKAKVGDELYGGLSILIQLQYSIKSLGILPASAFYPAPSIDSEALMLTPNDSCEELIKSVTPVVKAAFLHPRKKMVSNLKGVFPQTNWEEKVAALGKTSNTRAEELSLKDFIELCRP